MTPVTFMAPTAGGGVLTVVVGNQGATVAISGDSGAADSSVILAPAGSRSVATAWDTAEDTRDLENLATLQGQFETEMGAELIAYNSQALTKDPVTRTYTQAVTRIAFDSYQKGLDGPPV
ncbi:hypothetical protein QGX12_gp098 [Pseudomonas phage Kremar]|uniref:Uncharacterized protein n=1 Tax=Pseudomonas phage Kremar TaxID=2928831 RepID=A0AAE9KFQ4_9CAUD|nr:hypothetical protein QGX12_gp098 [Pseudomonas phage Kremar]UOL48546.1 hypothetical protein [Pseudomonas phage Kremar]